MFIGEFDAVRQGVGGAADHGDAGQLGRSAAGNDRGEVGGHGARYDGDGGPPRPAAPPPLAQGAGTGNERRDALAAFDGQHVAAVDDAAAAVAERLQRVQQCGAARRIGELAGGDRRIAEPYEGAE